MAKPVADLETRYKAAFEAQLARIAKSKVLQTSAKKFGVEGEIQRQSGRISVPEGRTPNEVLLALWLGSRALSDDERQAIQMNPAQKQWIDRAHREAEKEAEVTDMVAALDERYMASEAEADRRAEEKEKTRRESLTVAQAAAEDAREKERSAARKAASDDESLKDTLRRVAKEKEAEAKVAGTWKPRQTYVTDRDRLQRELHERKRYGEGYAGVSVDPAVMRDLIAEKEADAKASEFLSAAYESIEVEGGAESD